MIADFVGGPYCGEQLNIDDSLSTFYFHRVSTVDIAGIPMGYPHKVVYVRQWVEEGYAVFRFAGWEQ